MVEFIEEFQEKFSIHFLEYLLENFLKQLCNFISKTHKPSGTRRIPYDLYKSFKPPSTPQVKLGSRIHYKTELPILRDDNQLDNFAALSSSVLVTRLTPNQYKQSVAAKPFPLMLLCLSVVRRLRKGAPNSTVLRWYLCKSDTKLQLNVVHLEPKRKICTSIFAITGFFSLFIQSNHKTLVMK